MEPKDFLFRLFLQMEEPMTITLMVREWILTARLEGTCLGTCGDWR